MRRATSLRGASRLAVQATTNVTDLVEAMHGAIGGAPARLFSKPVYGSIRGVTKLVGASIDFALARLSPLLGDGAPSEDRDALVAVLNGVIGDYLEETRNPLATRMHLRRGESAGDGSKIAILVHGSSMNDAQWNRDGHDHGALLARDLGFVPVYVRYNSGLHVSTNGRALADAIEAFVRESPIPIESIVLIGHSMGGLVARSACHYGEVSNHAWRRALRSLVTIGAPHHGAPLERAGSMFELLLGVSRYSAPFKKLGRLRSAGVTDLRYGNVRDEDWHGRDRFVRSRDPRTPLPLPGDVACYAIAGTTTKTAPARGRILGDGLVPVDSALGKHAKPELALQYPEEHRWIAWGTGHLDLLSRQEVYDKLHAWLSE